MAYQDSSAWNKKNRTGYPGPARGGATVARQCGGEDEVMGEYHYLGNFAACEPWAAQGMSCDDCMVSWTGCWDNFQCPKCGKGELPKGLPATATGHCRIKSTGE